MNELEITIKASADLIDAIANRVIEKTKTNKPNPSNLLYTTKDVAKMLGKCKVTIARHIKKGLLIATKTGKSWTITEKNLNTYINGNN